MPVFHQVHRCLRQSLSLLEGCLTPASPGYQQNDEESKQVLQEVRSTSRRVVDKSNTPFRAMADNPVGQGTSSDEPAVVRESPAGPESWLERKRRLDGDREEDVIGGGRHLQQE